MRIGNPLNAVTILALCFIAACEEYTKLEPNNELVFLSADKNFRFQNMAFPRGTEFELVNVQGGRNAVWVNTTQASTAAGGMGAPVAIVSVQNMNGMMLDDNFCSTGDMLVNSIGITTVHPWDNYAARGSITKGVCFEPVVD